MILALVARWRHFPASTGGPARPGAAVFAFRNLTEHPAADWLSTALPEMVATEIRPANASASCRGKTSPASPRRPFPDRPLARM